MAKDKHPFTRVFSFFFDSEKVEEHTWKNNKINEKK